VRNDIEYTYLWNLFKVENCQLAKRILASTELVILPEHKRLSRYEVGKLSVIVGLGVDTFITSIQEAMSLGYPEDVYEDQKMKLAMNMYSSYFFELTPETKFIKLVTVLEALTPDQQVNDTTQRGLDVLKGQLKSELKKHEKESEEQKDINALLSRVSSLKRKPIVKSLEYFIKDSIKQDPEIGASKSIIQKVKGIYNRRSKLLHEGEINSELLIKDLNFLSGFVPILLKSIYKNKANRKIVGKPADD